MNNITTIHQTYQGPASAMAGQVDSVFIFILAITGFFFLITQGTLIYFAVKYRAKKGAPERATPDITGNSLLEAVWIVIPSILVVAIFYYGYTVFIQMKTPMKGAVEIHVVGKEWLWEFAYPDGRKSINELRVPVGKPVQLTMTSTDVIHGFFLPEFRLKQDVLPGRYTYIWFLPDHAGSYDIFCSQYCGLGHSTMRGRLIVMEQKEYAEWAGGGAEEKSGPLAENGEEIVKRSGCLGCHSTDGSAKVGPTFKGLYGSQVSLEAGGPVTADDDYIKESIYDPGAKVVKGFPNVMPTFRGTLKDEEVTAVIAYIKTVK